MGWYGMDGMVWYGMVWMDGMDGMNGMNGMDGWMSRQARHWRLFARHESMSYYDRDVSKFFTVISPRRFCLGKSCIRFFGARSGWIFHFFSRKYM